MHREDDPAGGGAGGAARASAAIERWLAAREKDDAEERRRLDAVLVRLRDCMASISASTLLRGDETAERLLLGFAEAQTMESLDADLSLLAGRVAELKGRGASAQDGMSGGRATPRRPARTLLKL